MNVNCIECEKDFSIHLQEYKHPVTKHKGYVIETYFHCPHCRKKYVSFVTDQRARKMQKNIKQFNKELPKKINTERSKKMRGELTEKQCLEAIDEHCGQLDSMKQELRERMDKLKQQVASV
ncbi:MULTISPECIES: hypothetical protein [unclassified Bacillus (in: firmicutes)]|uniref:hypothetical protein n=1 Tax=unclassified Bacillus (in: firmicutes) TaxID=185979 RepID=UPI001BEC08E5|nr:MULTISPECIES: hypothetical protein [unclassified Bacillus (in: firmicutes)]MBT2615316.1 hypothetical protein [Bacillus sp. ISL-78]MBT2628070.1 hypothetical protein [Bacillus sp. ISL-101]